ncbi:hypothetical protein BDZ97DRAFT_2058743 [Flammula alnicola]|nr:hypothetical protein BDZ97DRAFT_2058743 [Flammula alnicola]
MSTNFSPTPAELTVVATIFAQADPQKLGVLTGDVAVRVFGGAKLPPTTLGEIWNISDEDNKGWLPKKGVAIAVRLIGWAQKGEKITQALANKLIEGINTVTQQTTGMSLPKSPPPAAFPPLTTQDKAKFQNMFSKYGPANGLLSGDKARDIFVKSKLSNEQLLKIWNLADTQDRGALDSTDFAIGMYFIQGVMTGKLSFIPTALPPGLYQQAGGGASTGSIRSHMTGNSGSFSPVGSIFPQSTGQNQLALQPDYTGLSPPFKAPAFPTRSNTAPHTNGFGQDWDVTAAEKASSDRYFDTLDTQKKGYIEGEVAVPFMLKSQLPGEILAQVWDLADINNDGCLTRDGFAVAMHLIQKKWPVKKFLLFSASLVPPSARAATTVATSPFSPPHTQIQHQQPEPPVDLFSFDDTPPPSAVAPVHPTNTRAVPAHVTGGGFPAVPPRRATEPDPFSASPFRASPHHDLLSDDDTHPAASPPLQDQSAEIGNLKNHLQSTNRSLSTAKQERETLEQTLANQASQLSTIQTQLSSAKAAYETEVNLLATFKERRSTQVSDIQKARQELITAESNLSALRAEKAEIEGAFLRDKEEARDLHKRMVEVGQQADALKADVEKLKKEAKQQKGLLAIARKQLSTKESEKAKAEKEHEEAVAEAASITHEKDTVEAEIASLESAPAPKPVSPTPASPSPSASLMFAAAQPLPSTPEIPSSVKSNNPFERLAMASGPSSPRAQSPFSGLGVSSPPVLIAEATSPSAPVTSSNAAPEAVKEATKATDAFSLGLENTELSYFGDEHSESHAHDISASPVTANDTDYFMTPPTSAVNINESSPTSNPAERFPSLHDLSPPVPSAEKIPSLTLAGSPPAPAPAPAHPETDLNAHLKELDVEESDSDEDSDDDKPLGVLKATTTANGKAPELPSSPPQVVGHLTPAVAAALAPTASFDDVFGSDEPHATSLSNGHATPFDLPAAAPDQSKGPLDSKILDDIPVAGVNEFDEALGKIPSSAAATPATFSLIRPLTITSISLLLRKPLNSPPSSTSASRRFDSVTAPKLEDKPFTVPSPAVLNEGPSVPGPSRVTYTRAVSPPPRARSPPARAVSPKPRLSSSSSKEAQEKAPAPRHSKLSLQIRLPFGKKKKHVEPMPAAPAHHLSPPMEQTSRVATPANEDDVEPVKQLTDMGFSRSQAVDALEKYGYDVQKALNSLLVNDVLPFNLFIPHPHTPSDNLWKFVRFFSFFFYQVLLYV